MSGTDQLEIPAVLVVDDEPLNRDFVREILIHVSWRVVVVESGVEALANLVDLPALILMDLHMAGPDGTGMDGVATTAAIRARGDAAASVPIVAFTTTYLADVAPLHARGFDDFLAKPCTPRALVAMLDRWRPDGAAAALPRLQETFGQSAIRDLTRRYRGLLVEAIAALDAGDAGEVAHRVAGISGTLGFADLGRQWLALSLGDASIVPALRRATRRALAAIDRDASSGR